MSKLDFVFDLGGSIVNPGRLSKSFLQEFSAFVNDYVKQGKTFGIIVGGGFLTRAYQNFLRDAFNPTDEDLDSIGIRPTKLNAELIRILLKEYAYPFVLESPEAHLEDFERFKIFVFSGWKPGRSTDYVSVLVAKRFGVKKVFCLTNIDGVYPVTHGKIQKGRVIARLPWDDYEKIIDTAWTPGMKVPFDPVATKEAKETEMEVIILEGRRLQNLKKAMEGESFLGTIIS